MSLRDLQTDAARERARAAVERLEAQSAAEVVVAVVPHVIDRRAPAAFAALIAGLAALALLVFLPEPFDPDFFVVEVAIAMALGAAALRLAPGLERVLAGRAAARHAIEREARHALHRLGVDRTRDRTGLLVLVALLEREVAVVRDHGLQLDALDAPIAAAEQAATDALRRGDAEALFAALEGLGPALAAARPRRADDTNELPDGLVVDTRGRAAR
jgi:putative membrane protein